MDRSDKMERILEWQAGKQPPPGPQCVVVFPTNICNLTCEHCWLRWGEYDKSYKSEMSDARLLELVEEGAALGAKSWYFVGGGDPMARGKTVMAMTKRIREHGMNGGIHCNGTLFRPGMLEQLVDTGWYDVHISLDGPTAEINDAIRSKGFEKATESARQLSILKRERGVDTPKITLYATVTNLTYDKIDQFVELAHRLGPDVRLETSGLIVQGDATPKFELTPEQKEVFPVHVRKAVERARELGVDNNLELYLNEELIHDGMDMVHRVRIPEATGLARSLCLEPWTSMMILPDGRVGPCCAFDAQDAMSVKDHSMADVWNGAYMNGVREGMLTGNMPHYCRRCPSNLYMNKERDLDIHVPVLWSNAQWRDMPRTRKVALMARRGALTLRKHGVRTTLRRTAEWAYLRGIGRGRGKD